MPRGRREESSAPTRVDLDDALAYSRFDPSGMRRFLHQFPAECRRAWQRVSRFHLPATYAGIDGVLIAGMGGSAAAGDIVRHLAANETKVPIWVHRDYGLPSSVDEDTLVIFSSYSGNTEETLSAFETSLNTPAKKLVITTGGKLGDLAEQQGIPVLLIDYQAPTRAAFPHSLASLLGILVRLGLLPDRSVDWREALLVLDGLSTELAEVNPLASNRAKQLATRMQGSLAVIYGAELLSGVALRWKTQLNENSKTWAFCELFPELNHNAAVGYKLPSWAKEKVFVVLLSSPSLHPRNHLRYEATTEVLAATGVDWEIVNAMGQSPLAQVMSLVLLGDYLSFYLAILNRTDPTPVDSIDFVKSYLARSGTPAIVDPL
jgi:glucose/mannose-6-phosphate isomerase